MKVNQKLHQAKLAKWVALLQDQASSGLPVKEWCAQNDVTVHAYYYWKRLAKEAYINSIIPEIVPLPAVQIQESPSCSSDQPSLDLRKPEDASGNFSHFSPPGLCDSHNSRNVNKDPVPSHSTLSVSIGDVRIEIGSSAPDDLVLKLIQAARYA